MATYIYIWIYIDTYCSYGIRTTYHCQNYFQFSDLLASWRPCIVLTSLRIPNIFRGRSQYKLSFPAIWLHIDAFLDDKRTTYHCQYYIQFSDLFASWRPFALSTLLNIPLWVEINTKWVSQPYGYILIHIVQTASELSIVASIIFSSATCLLHGPKLNAWLCPFLKPCVLSNAGVGSTCDPNLSKCCAKHFRWHNVPLRGAVASW